ncbi:hypothetical protein SAMN04487916_12228 [Arthrobacter sp. ov407]|uniref:hypothetical protein n=1 Tax=Arthrobacter sp. ov407 TaxID=1761748 RepID=UPI00087E8FC1|nr:hypothetical protein [Arthrobacter sp. ov407]SDM02926.1 hypothetical protein SAMN04487916_12228 [Arthrobacter sp. ov407]
MSNLGLYEWITTQAKIEGGVENLIKTIESGAAKKALKEAGPVLVGVGVLAGVVGTKVLDAAKNARAKYKQSQAAAAEAKEQLKAVVEESVNSDEAPADGPDDIGDKN